MSRSRPIAALIVIGLLTEISPGATACTGIRLVAKDGAVVCARTMEFALDLRSSILVVPRGTVFSGSAPGEKPGMRWTSRYGIAGANGFGLPIVVDGLNEKGLGVGIFYFPGYAGYQDIGDSDRERALAPHELATYLLGTCANATDAVEAAKGVKVGDVVAGPLGIVPPVHYVVHDADGRCMVLEYVDGRLNVHDNPIGAITNAPTFDWHVTNLRNYVNLSVTEVPPIELGRLNLAPFGMGSGLRGLPGDFTPPSRFVRAAVFSGSAPASENGRAAVLQAFHILNQFDIPRGSARHDEGGKIIDDFTPWTSASDLKARRYYFHTYQDRRVRMVDLGAASLEGGPIKTIPMAGEEEIEDVTGRAR